MEVHKKRVLEGTCSAKRDPTGFWSITVDDQLAGPTEVHEPLCRQDGAQVRVTYEYLSLPNY